MMDLLAVLLPVLLADIMNPVLFGFMVYAAGTKSPITASSAALLGHTLTYFTFGFILAPGIEKLTARMATPHSMDYVIGLVIGLILIWVAYISSRDKQPSKPMEPGNLSPIKAFGIGSFINFIGIPFALPYFAALGQILKANLTTLDSVLVLIAYNLGYAVPFMVIPILVAATGDASRDLLKDINSKVETISSYLMPIILGMLGLTMVVDSLIFFYKGKGLF